MNLSVTLTAYKSNIMLLLTSILIYYLITSRVIQLVYTFLADSAFIPNFRGDLNHKHGLWLVIEKDMLDE